MYNQHFGLDRAPFKITPDTSQFFSGADRGSVLEAIMYAIESGEGIVKVIGEVGTGKTMLCRMLQLRLPEDVELVYIANPNVSAENILNVIAMELKIIDEPVSKLAAQNALQNYLLQMHATNRRVVVFVEEAQGMPIDTLEEIRMLTNLETDTDKLLQIVLFGQPELDKNLMQPSIRQLKERIAHNFYLKPLHVKDIREYLNFRTRNTGYHGPDLFSEPVAKAIGKYSKGLIRRVNIIADKAMLAAYADGTNSIQPHHVKKAIADSDFNANYYWQKTYRWLLVALALLLLVLGSVYLYMQFFSAPKISRNVDSEQTSIVQRESIQPIQVEEPAVQTEIAETTYTTPEPTVVIEPVISEVAEEAEIDVESAKIDAYYIDENIKKEYWMLGRLGYQYLSERLMVTHDWLKNASDGEYTIQIMLLRDRSLRSLEAFLGQIRGKVALEKVYVYETRINNKLMYGVLYDQFDSKQSANKGMKNLPGVFESSRPVMLRTIKGIRDEVARSKI